jgi:parvulin-like peptidyl-prolyl isomerase
VIRYFALTFALSGCVVTTLEGPGDPPRVAAPPGKISREATQTQAPPGPEAVRARHLLVAYRGAERASPQITRTKLEANERAHEALQRARAGVDFEALVTEYSDEPGAAERGGDLGKFKRNMMVKPFADAAFALKPGELSEVVETTFGFHVIQRIE